MAERLYRYLEPAAEDFDEKARTLRVAFASETPVLRVGTPRDKLVRNGEEFYEVLDHSPENVDLSALNDAGPFLDEHREERQLGKVKGARVDADRISRAELVYDETTLANDRYGQMRSRTRPHISAGYRWKAIIGKDRAADGLPIYRFSWAADEISSVALPADRKVGVGRSAADLQVDFEKLPDAEKTILRNKFMSEKTEPLVIDETKVRADEREKVITASKTRMKQIIVACDELIKDHGTKDAGKFGDKLRSLANECLEAGTDIGEFQVRAMKEVLKASPAKPVLIEDCTDDVNAYSLLRGIQSAAKNRMAGKEGIPNGREGEVHQEIVRRSQEFGGLGYEAAGFQVPCNARLRMGSTAQAERRMTRDMQATQFNAGGAFVPTQLMVPIIELLRNRLILEKAGMTSMAGLQGNFVIPRQEAAATAFVVSEIAALTASQQILGQIALTPHRVGATQDYSKQFVMQSTPDAEAFMRDDLFKVIALAWDRLGIFGTGAASEPTGILSQPGIGSIVFAGAVSYGKVVDMETAIRSANVTDPLCYISTSSSKGAMKKVAEALTGATTVGGSENAIWKGRGDAGEVNGWPAYDSQQIPNNAMICGAFSQLIHAMWGGLDVVVDIYTKATNAEIRITINTWGDYAVRHPQAFVASADAANG